MSSELVSEEHMNRDRVKRVRDESLLFNRYRYRLEKNARGCTICLYGARANNNELVMDVLVEGLARLLPAIA